jgi:predicted P-loop ATPase
VLVPGIKADMVPVAVGPQGAMKSSSVAAIVPAPDFFLELDLGSKDDDLARLMRGKLVIELGELKGLRAKEMEHVKAFITRQHEEWIPKYREMNVRYSRRGIFFATTNQDEFLSDDTGNRRWLPFRTGRCDPEGVKAAREQLWAEAREAFKSSGVVWQEAERLGGNEHEAFVVRDAWEPIVRTWLDEIDPFTDDAPRARDFLQTHEVLSGALRFDPRNITRREEIRIGSVLQKLGYQRDRRRVNGARTYVYVPASLSVPNLSLSETG